MSGPGEHTTDCCTPDAHVCKQYAYDHCTDAPEKPRESDVLAGFVDEIQDLRIRLLGSTIRDVPGRTADVKHVALLRLQQAADVMAEEAVVLERSGE
jgi:hypothetical protein